MMIFEWIYFIIIITILCLPTFLIFDHKRLYDNLIERIIKSFFVGFFQFFIIALLVFYCKMPINLYGWLIVYLIHISLTLILGKYIRNQGNIDNKKNSFVFGKTFWLFIIFIGIFLMLYFFETIRHTRIVGDSAFYWFVKGWTFYNTQDIYVFKYLHAPYYPLLIPLIYNFFLQVNCGLGIAGYTALLLIAAILLTLVMGWLKAGKLSIMTGIPSSMFLPILFNEWVYHSYADIPLSIVYYIALITLIDALFYKKSFYPAMLLLTVVPMMKSNGLYLLLPAVFISIFFMFCNSKNLKDTTINSILIFGLPFVFLIIFKILLYKTSTGSRITTTFMPVLINEIIQTPNPIIAFWHKLVPSVMNFIYISIRVPRNIIFLFPFFSLLIYPRFSTKNRFLLLNIIMTILVTVCIVYALVPDADRQWWFDYGYRRTLSLLVPSIVGFVYLSSNEFLARFRKELKMIT